jgi:hypothetical protein
VRGRSLAERGNQRQEMGAGGRTASSICAVVRFGGSCHRYDGQHLSPGVAQTLMGLAGPSEYRLGATGDRMVSSLPLWSWPEGRPVRSSQRRAVGRSCECPDHPLLAFRSPPECDRTDAADGGQATSGCLPCGSLPFGVFLVAGSHSPRGIPAPEYVPPQRFSRSRGLFPPAACRPCFMPVPPLGFCPSGSISTRRAGPHLGVPCPHVVHRRSDHRLDSRVFHELLGLCPCLSRLPLLRRLSCRRLHSRASIPASVRIRCPVGWTGQRTATLMGFTLPRGFPHLAGGHPSGRSSHGLDRRCAR